MGRDGTQEDLGSGSGLGDTHTHAVGHSRAHRVGEMSHGFDVEQLLKYELQLILRALGRPGRGAGGEQPSMPPLPTTSRGADPPRPGTIPGQAASFSPWPWKRCSGRPIHSSPFATPDPHGAGSKGAPLVVPPQPLGTPLATHGLRRAMASSASGPSWARKPSASSSSSASRSPAPGSGLSSSSAKR